MSKGSWYRPVKTDVFSVNYTRIFGTCNSTQCPKRYKCLLWLRSPSLFDNINREDFYANLNGSNCPYFYESTTSNPDTEEVKGVANE